MASVLVVDHGYGTLDSIMPEMNRILFRRRPGLARSIGDFD